MTEASSLYITQYTQSTVSYSLIVIFIIPLQVHGITGNDAKLGPYESESEDSISSGSGLSVTRNADSPQSTPIVPTTTATTANAPLTSHPAPRAPELEWFCQSSTIGPQPATLPTSLSGPPPPHHLSHHFNHQLMHHQAAY